VVIVAASVVIGARRYTLIGGYSLRLFDRCRLLVYCLAHYGVGMAGALVNSSLVHRGWSVTITIAKSTVSFSLRLPLHGQNAARTGTGAFFYFRPHKGGANADKWVIQLQGGGNCRNGADCFNRWCSVDTNFGMQGMTATASPDKGIKGRGILNRRGDNPLGDFNQVFVRYCSSDAWGGDAGDVVVTAPHPVTGVDVTARLQFRGWKIIDAVLATLRHDGVAAPTYTIAGGSTAMPDLDDATVVMLAGGSAGGTGTTLNLDRVADELRAKNTDCQGGTCKLQVGGIIDSAFAADRAHFDFAHTEICAASQGQLCKYPDVLNWEREMGPTPFHGQRDDASCVAYHEPTNDTYLCTDMHHVVMHHVTTPFLLRMGQSDENLSGSALDAGYYYNDAALDLAAWAQLLQGDLRDLAEPTGHEEGADYTMTPAVFGPTCDAHETLSDDDQVYGVTVDDPDGNPTKMFELLGAWTGGATPAYAIATTPKDNVCK
jgi:hypothetical protein